jgi:hypothetical protein
LEFEKIKAWRLEPYGERLGRYSIDGEVNKLTYELRK